jgi:multiple sugar transport system ATP-binding protein
VPFEAPAEIVTQLAELASELDSEQMRTQICVELDPLSRVRNGDKATLWLDAERIHLFDPQSGDNLTRTAAEEHAPGDSGGRHAATTG